MENSNRFKLSDVNRTAFLKLPKFLLKLDISYAALVLYAHILERIEWSIKSKWMNNRGEIYCIFTREDMCAQLHCSQPTIRKALSQLKTAGLIDEERQGLNRPNLIYLCVSAAQEEVLQIEQQEQEIPFTPECKDSFINNKEINKTDNDTYLSIDLDEDNQSIPSPSPTDCEQNSKQANVPIDSHSTYNYNETLNHMKKQMDYDTLIDHKLIDSDNLDELLHIITDILCSSKPFIRINGENIHTDAVKERFLRLGSNHLEYVIECLANVSGKVRNIRAYLLTSLFNAPTTINSYYRLMVNHDFACRVS